MLTPSQFKSLRKERKLTREEMAKELGADATAAKIVHWEHGTNKIPEWVCERLLASVPITLPLEDLQLLMMRAKDEGETFTQLLTNCIRAYLGPTTPKNVSQMPTDYLDVESAMVAEDPAPYPSPPNPTQPKKPNP